MINVTRLNGKDFWVSADQIEFVEATPDSVISLVSGKKVVVKESPEEILSRLVEFRRSYCWNPEFIVDKRGKEKADIAGDAG